VRQVRASPEKRFDGGKLEGIIENSGLKPLMPRRCENLKSYM